MIEQTKIVIGYSKNISVECVISDKFINPIVEVLIDLNMDWASDSNNKIVVTPILQIPKDRFSLDGKVPVSYKEVIKFISDKPYFKDIEISWLIILTKPELMELDNRLKRANNILNSVGELLNVIRENRH